MLKRLVKGTREQGVRTVQRFCDLRYYVRYERGRQTCVRSAYSCAYARAHGSTYGRRGQTDRDKEHFRTRAGRDQGPRICCCWQGEAQENPRESHTWVPTLPLIRSLPFVSRSLGPARPHHRALPLCLAPHSVFHLALDGLLPIPGVHYLSFFSTSSVLPSYKWRAPSLVMSCPTVSCASDECSFR